MALVFSSGCKKKAPTTAQDARPPVTAKAPDTEVAPPPAPTTSRDVTSDVLRQDVAEMNKKGYLTDAYFDYDQSDLREDARTALAADAEWLKKYPSVQILIEGYCDERGTGNYNLALGDRRANAAKEYLVSLGIDAIPDQDRVLRRRAPLLHGVARGLLAAEPPGAPRDHGQVA